MKTLILILAALPAFAQQTNRYFDSYSGSLSASSSITFTIQQPAANANQVLFEGQATGLLSGVSVQCPGQSFTVAQAMNGTAATATAGTIIKMPGTFAQPQHTFWTSSNVGSGTAFAPLFTWPSGTVPLFDWSSIRLGTSGTATNISLTITNTGSASCTVAFGAYVREQS